MRSISYPRRAALGLIAALLAVVGLTACDPSDPVQFQQWIDLNPTEGRYVSAETMNEPQRAVVDHIQAEQGKFLAAVAAYEARSADCYGAIRRVWPSSTWSWADSIVRRESNNTPSADNPSSSASGCFQLLSLHAWRFDAVGCSWGLRYDAVCNAKAAYHLYQAAGSSPWRL